MRKFSILLALCITLNLTTVFVLAEESTTVVGIFLDEKEVTFEASYGAPFIDGANRTQIPFRGVLEAFGAEVRWDPDQREAIATKEDIEIRVPIGERFIIKDTEVILMDTEAVILNGRTYIPVRAVLEAFGASVDWDANIKRVDITSPPAPLVISRLPELYDLRAFGKTTAIKNQLDIGACWAFATIGAIESALLPDVRYDFSEDHISLSHGYDLTQDEGGDFQISLAYLSRWSGPVYEVQDPYGDGVFTPDLKAAIHVQEAIILPEKDYPAIKRAILQYGGVQTSIHIRDIESQQLGDAFNDFTDSFYYTGDELPNHDVVIVGWDDTFSKSNFNVTPTRDGAFICRNSYGDTFGTDGYFYVSYDDVLVGRENIVYSGIEANDNYDKIYQSDWLGWVGRIGFGKDTAYFSNVYTTEGKESLEAVSFYATDMDTNYEIYVVEDFVDVNDYEKMTFVTRGGVSYAGYYTVNFDMPIPVEGTYAVVVKITTPGSSFPVAAEYAKDVAWLKDVDITDGTGYMSYDGTSWENTETVLDSNLCLKAFTNIEQVVGEPLIEEPLVEEAETEPEETDETEQVDEAEVTEEPIKEE